ncbi:MAG: hypothetical protein A2W22_00370 [Candidatus Levybacteria bacterium RBG_16_35_11]|nr:MAG: hypothetical protein A2W22_00370 [Candidatus Levybacteria bacterium RBG_16_35_11]
MKKFVFIPLFLIITIIFFYPTFLKGLLPIPSDTVVGLYHPFRDFFANQFPNGIPFKNFLLTDPVRQQYPWKELSISLLKINELPLWNPFNLSGTPLLANFQSSPFYILNIMLFFMPFKYGWSLLVISQIFLSCLFLYLYLKNLKLSIGASIFGALAFSFSGFSIAWLEWGTILQTALWLPLILYSIDKVFFSKKKTFYLILLILSLCFSLFAGHPQLSFYVLIFFVAYFFSRFLQQRKKEFILIFFYTVIPFLVITSIQWLPSLQFNFLSARSIDQNWQIEGWFIPWQNLIQFIAPDFFGNPATLNYWGIWNYGELVNYLGILPFIFGVFCLFYRKDRKTLFFGTAFFLSLIFSLPTIFAKLPYLFKVPLISGFQPTRLNFITDFSMAVLAAMGIDYFAKQKTDSHFYKKKKNVFYPVIFTGLILVVLWVFVLKGDLLLKQISSSDLLVSKNNLYLPTLIFLVSILILFLSVFKKKKEIFYSLIILVLIFDLFRFGWKFTPFSSANYLFPNTKITTFLEKAEKPFRIMSSDSRILPPNFSSVYKIESIEGYDPLYLLRYGELIAAMERGKPDISPPFGFNRIITPHNYKSPLINLLGVKYLLTFDEVFDQGFNKVLSEGKTNVYENKNALPRAFFIEQTINAKNKQEAINLLFKNSASLNKLAIVEGASNINLKNWTVGEAKILEYKENKIIIETENRKEGFLVLTDSFYPTWHVKINGNEGSIYRTDYNFRGVIIPAGSHKVEFYNTLF